MALRIHKVVLALSPAFYLVPAAVAAPVLMEEVFVTAHKTPLEQHRAAVSVAVLDGDYLDDKHIRSLAELSLDEPAVFVAKNAGAEKIFVRGIGSQGNAGMEQSASTYIDDVYHGRSRSAKAAVVDVERVEILKGPQSLFYGLNTTAGAFTVHTRKAQFGAAEALMQAHVASAEQVHGQAVYNRPVADRLALRGVLDVTRRQAYWDMVDPVSGADTGDGDRLDQQLLRLAAAWRPHRRPAVNVALEAQNTTRDNPFAWQPGGCDNLYGLGLGSQGELDQFWADTGSAQASPLQVPFTCGDDFIDNTLDAESPASPNNTSDFTYQRASAQFTYDLGFATVLANSAFFNADYEFAGNDLSHGGPPNHLMWSQDDSRQASQELRLFTADDARLHWHVGAYWHRNHVDYRSATADGRRQGRFSYSLLSARQRETQYAVYGSLGYRLTEALHLNAGLRWDQSRKVFSGSDSVIASNRLTPAQQAAFVSQIAADTSARPGQYESFPFHERARFDNTSARFSDRSPSLGLQYLPSNRLNLYYQWRRGVKSGGFNFRLTNLSEADLVYASERVNAHEVGLKWRDPSQGLRLQFALFDAGLRDLQQNSNRSEDGGSGMGVIRNAAAATSRGLELAARWNVGGNVSANYSATWLRAEFDDYRGASCTRLQSVVATTDVAEAFGAQRVDGQCTQDLSGATLSFAPRFAARLGLAKVFHWPAAMRVSTRLEWIHSEGFFTSPHADPLRRQASYDKFNVLLTLSPAHARWSLSLVGNNITNALTSRQLGQDGNAAVSALVDPPRQWLLQTEVRLGG